MSRLFWTAKRLSIEQVLFVLEHPKQEMGRKLISIDLTQEIRKLSIYGLISQVATAELKPPEKQECTVMFVDLLLIWYTHLAQVG